MSPPAFQLQAGPAAPPADGSAGVAQLQEVQAPVAEAAAPAAEAAAPAAEAAAGLPAEFLDHLRLREGDVAATYNDSLGFPTAGVGHLLTAAERVTYPVGTVVPQEVRDAWLEADATAAHAAATTQAATLGVTDPAFVNALGSVNFQLGTAWNTEHRNTWAHMTNGEWEAAATEAADSTWNTQTPVRVQDFQAALRSQIAPAPAPDAGAPVVGPQ